MALVGVALDLGQEAHRRDRDAVGADPGARGVAQDARGLDDVVVVLEGLALALEDGAGQRPLGRLAADGERLLDHLPRLEVPEEAEAAGLAEGAAEGAADLRGEAHAPARLLEGDAHRLEDAPVAGAEEVLDERVDGAAPAVDHLEPVEAAPRAQLGREGLRQAAHARRGRPGPRRPRGAGRAGPRPAAAPGKASASVSAVCDLRCTATIRLCYQPAGRGLAMAIGSAGGPGSHAGPTLEPADPRGIPPEPPLPVAFGRGLAMAIGSAAVRGPTLEPADPRGSPAATRGFRL